MNVFGKLNTTAAKIESKKKSLENQLVKLNKYLVINLDSIRHDFNEKIKKLEEDSVKCLKVSEFDVLHKNLDEFKKVKENISFSIESGINHDEMISKLKDELSDDIDKTFVTHGRDPELWILLLKLETFHYKYDIPLLFENLFLLFPIDSMVLDSVKSKYFIY